MAIIQLMSLVDIFISNYLRDAKTANDFSDNEKLEKMVYLVRHRQVALCYFLRKKKAISI